MEIATRAVLPDTLKWIKVSAFGWREDGFFYSRYPAPEAVTRCRPRTSSTRCTSTSLGTAQADDKLVYEDKAQSATFPHRAND